MSVKLRIRSSVSDGFTSVEDRLAERRLGCYSILHQKMAFGLDFSAGHVSELNTFYSGHYWPTACMDMNNNDNYAQDAGEYIYCHRLGVFTIALVAKL